MGPLLLLPLLVATVLACFVMWLAWRGQAPSPPPPTPPQPLISNEAAAREQLRQLAWRLEQLRRTHLSITLRPAWEWPSDEFVRRLNIRLFSGCADSVALFQPMRSMLDSGVPTWHCPPLVIDPYNAATIGAGDTSVELVVLQRVETSYRDEDDRCRTFLLPLSPDCFQVMQVPSCSNELRFTVLKWSEVRALLRNGYRSVGRDDVVDYGRPVPVARWEDRHHLRQYGVEFISIGVSKEDALRIARYATGRLLRHLRHLRPRGAVSSKWRYRHGPTPEVRLSFRQRYSVNIRPKRSITGRLVSIGNDADYDDYDDDEFRSEWAAVDVSHAGEVLRIFVIGSSPDEFVRSAGAQCATIS